MSKNLTQIQVESSILKETPFSKREVAYCESKLIRVSEREEEYRDSDGHYQRRTVTDEDTVSHEKTEQEIQFIDDSSDEPIVLEINAKGCDLDIPETYNRFQTNSNLDDFGFLNSFSIGRSGSRTIGYRMIEKTIEANQNLYVIGEAFKVGNTIHIGKPQDKKKPFIVTTKSEEELINSEKQKSLFCILGGIVLIIIGIVVLLNGR